MKPTKGPAKPKKPLDKPKKPFRTRTYHRTEDGGPTGGFDKAGAEDRVTRPERPFRPARAYAPRPPRPAAPERQAFPPRQVFPERQAPALPPAPASAAGEFSLTLPAELGKRLEAHANALGIDTQALVRVWLSDKLRPQK